MLVTRLKKHLELNPQDNVFISDRGNVFVMTPKNNRPTDKLDDFFTISSTTSIGQKAYLAHMMKGEVSLYFITGCQSLAEGLMRIPSSKDLAGVDLKTGQRYEDTFSPRGFLRVSGYEGCGAILTALQDRDENTRNILFDAAGVYQEVYPAHSIPEFDLFEARGGVMTLLQIADEGLTSLGKSRGEYNMDIFNRYNDFYGNVEQMLQEDVQATSYRHFLSTTRGIFELVREGYLESMDYTSYVIEKSVEYTFDVYAEDTQDIINRVPSASLGWDIMSELTTDQQVNLVAGFKRKAFSAKEKASLKYLQEWARAHGYKDVLKLPVLVYESEVNVKAFSWDLPRGVYKASHLKGLKLSPDMLINSIKWSTLFGTSVKNLTRYRLRHYRPVVEAITLPVNKVDQVSKNDDLIEWIVNTDLVVDWGVSKSAKVCVLEAIKATYGVSQQDAETFLTNPSLRVAADFARENPNKSIPTNPVLKNKVWETSKYRLEMLPKQDLSNLYIGAITECCQHLLGEGREVCEVSWTDEHSINYVVKSKESGNIYAHFWAWVSAQGQVVIDSIEGRHNEELTEHVVELVKQFAKEQPTMLSTTYYGFTKDVAEKLGLHNRDEAVELHAITYYPYADADTAWAL